MDKGKITKTNRSFLTSNPIGRMKAIRWRQGKNFNAVCRYTHGMLKLRRKRFIARDSGPIIRQNFCLRPP